MTSTGELRELWHLRCGARVIYMRKTEELRVHALATIGFLPPVISMREQEAERMRSQGIVPLYNELCAHLGRTPY